MRSIFLVVISVLLCHCLKAQKVYQIRADSVRIYSGCDTAELIIENRTKDTIGYLYNKGKGRTEFRKLRLMTVGNHSIGIEGMDTLDLTPVLSGGSGTASTLQAVTDKDSVTTHSIATGGYKYILPSYKYSDYFNTSTDYPVSLLDFRNPQAFQQDWDSAVLSIGSNPLTSDEKYLQLRLPGSTSNSDANIRIYQNRGLFLRNTLLIDKASSGIAPGPRIRGAVYDEGDGPFEYVPIYIGKDEPIYLSNSSTNTQKWGVGIGYFNGEYPGEKLHVKKGNLRIDEGGILVKTTAAIDATGDNSDLRMRALVGASYLTSSTKNTGGKSHLVLQNVIPGIDGTDATAAQVGNVGIKTPTPGSTLEVKGSFAVNGVVTTNASMALGENFVILCNNTAAISLTLPLASTCPGRMYVVKKIATATADITINRSGSDLIDGLPSCVVKTYLAAVTIISNGLHWYIISQ